MKDRLALLATLVTMVAAALWHTGGSGLHMAIIVGSALISAMLLVPPESREERDSLSSASGERRLEGDGGAPP